MTLQEIAEDYEKFKPKESQVNSSSELYKVLLNYQDNIKESVKAYKQELKENKRMYLEAKVRNFFFFIFQEEEASFYYYDNALIKEMIREMFIQLENIKDLLLIVDDSNYQDVQKIAEFLMMHYYNNIDFWEKVRQRLEMSLENAILYNDLKDTREKINVFMELLINAYYEKIIKVEKIKKIW